MVFSSTVFIFCFLPLVLALSLIVPTKRQNLFLLLASFVFYAWGGVGYSAILILSIGFNYGMGRLMDSFPDRRKAILTLGIGLNLGLLVLFKYADFLVANVNNALGTAMDLPQIQLPIGISFFIFQAISYLIDVYRREVKVQKKIIDLALYISLFPQLIAGPIVRYHDIALQLKSRVRYLPLFASGIERFIIGLSKKVLLANTFAVLADEVFTSSPELISPTMAILGTLAYSFQIYFDFSGYSDMAIGLGRMFGFDFKENFNFPYVARSIQDFWRRWHISLSSWFRDYLYIPLGGNRGSVQRTYINLFLVFLCTGFWHGASWNFIFWGLFHGLFLILERLFLAKILGRIWSPISQIYTFLIVIMAWIFFRVEDFNAGLIISRKFLHGLWSFHWDEALSMLQMDILIAFFIAGLSMLPILERNYQKALNKMETSRYTLAISSLRYLILLVLFISSLSFLSASTFNPFIYFRF